MRGALVARLALSATPSAPRPASGQRLKLLLSCSPHVTRHAPGHLSALSSQGQLEACHQFATYASYTHPPPAPAKSRLHPALSLLAPRITVNCVPLPTATKIANTGPEAKHQITRWTGRPLASTSLITTGLRQLRTPTYPYDTQASSRHSAAGNSN